MPFISLILGSSFANELTLRLSGAWKTGPRRDSAVARWEPNTVLQLIPQFSIARGQRKAFRVPINFQEKIAHLEPNGRWPFEFKVAVDLSAGRRDAPDH